VDLTLDRDALAKEKLAEQLKARRLLELTAKGRAPESIATFQIAPEDRERLLREAFVGQFGTNISEIIQTNLARLMATNRPSSTTAAMASPAPRRGLFRFVTGLFAGRGSGGRTKAEKHLPKADREALGLATPDLMETLLAEKIEVTNEEFRQLTTARARWVQDWLVQQGLLAASRVFLVAPRPVDASYRGETRAILSLN